MDIFLTAIGVAIFLLVILSAFSYGRHVESAFHTQSVEFAKACVQEYQNYVNHTYYSAESYRRWASSCQVPDVPQMQPLVYERNRHVELPGDNSEFVSRFQTTGQATMYLGSERNGQ